MQPDHRKLQNFLQITGTAVSDERGEVCKPVVRMSRYPIPKSDSMMFLIHVLTSPQVIFFRLKTLLIKITDHATAMLMATHILKNENSLTIINGPKFPLEF